MFNHKHTPNTHLRSAGIVLMLMVVGLIFQSGCAGSGGYSQFDLGINHGYGSALAKMIQDHFARYYLPHALALQAAEGKIKQGIAPSLAVAGLDTLPGVKGIVVASQIRGESFTLPGGAFNLADNDFLQLSPDSLPLMKVMPYKRSMPVHNRLLGGKYCYHELKTGKGTEQVLVSQGLITNQGNWITIGYILDESWIIKQIPAQMDSLIYQNYPLVLAKTNPAGGMWDSDIAIERASGDLSDPTKTYTAEMIWSTEDYGKRETTVMAYVWPFVPQMTIAVGVYYVPKSKNTPPPKK